MAPALTLGAQRDLSVAAIQTDQTPERFARDFIASFRQSSSGNLTTKEAFKAATQLSREAVDQLGIEEIADIIEQYMEKSGFRDACATESTGALEEFFTGAKKQIVPL